MKLFRNFSGHSPGLQELPQELFTRKLFRTPGRLLDQELFQELREDACKWFQDHKPLLWDLTSDTSSGSCKPFRNTQTFPYNRKLFFFFFLEYSDIYIYIYIFFGIWRTFPLSKYEFFPGTFLVPASDVVSFCTKVKLSATNLADRSNAKRTQNDHF